MGWTLEFWEALPAWERGEWLAEDTARRWDIEDVEQALVAQDKLTIEAWVALTLAKL